MIRCDAHMHTRFSEDSDASVHSMLDAAIERGMEAVCITDHLDKDFPQTPDFPAGAFLLVALHLKKDLMGALMGECKPPFPAELANL